jgi:integrase
MVADLDRSVVRTYLDGLSVGQQTKANARNALHRFGAWLVERGHLAANPVSDIRIGRKQRADELPRVFSPAQAEAWLRACEAPKSRGILGWAVLCTLCGLRPANEAPRLTWAEINLDAATLNACGTKRGQKPRVMQLQPAAVAWLRCVARDNAGTPGYFSRRMFRRAVDAANAALPARERIEWQEDIQRHTFASYRLAQGADVVTVAAEMGNSPRVIYAHYKHPRPAADAERFWALKPG